MTVDQGLVDYFTKMAQRRSQRVRDTMEALTPREALLVREAAVMGYVQGQQDARAGYIEIPLDLAILYMTVLGCLGANDSNSRHFRLIAAASEGRRPRVEKGSWK